MDSESFGVAAVEAMACEIPVIATDVDGFTEVISMRESGFIVHRDAPEEMAEATKIFSLCVKLASVEKLLND